jgi:hypothetical protein
MKRSVRVSACSCSAGMFLFAAIPANTQPGQPFSATSKESTGQIVVMLALLMYGRTVCKP